MTDQISAPPIWYLGISPEVVLIVGAMLILLTRAFAPKRVRLPLASALGVASLLASATLSAILWVDVSRNGPQIVVSRVLTVDGFAVFFKFIFIGIGILALVLATSGLRRERVLREEFPALVLMACAGMMLMAASNDLILTFLALELFSLSFYVIAAFARDRLGPQEAALKYFLLGAFSSAFFLYGIALVYGTAGSTNLGDIATFLGRGTVPWIFIAGMALLLVGLAFKIGAVPFHMWVPDVYQGAPSQVVGFLAAGAKAAGIAALLRIFVGAFGDARVDWLPVIAGLSMVTMLVGALIALVQQNIKRMLAYSSIVHAGYLLLGVAAANQAGVSASLFYLVSYSLMIFGAFAVVALVAGRGDGATQIDDFRGLARRRPGLAALFTVFLLGLAGIPPTSGFVAKFVLFEAAVGAGLWWLTLGGVIVSVIAAYFYLRVIVVMFVSAPEDVQGLSAIDEPDAAITVGLALTFVFTIALGVLPQVLLNVVDSARMLIPGL